LALVALVGAWTLSPAARAEGFRLPWFKGISKPKLPSPADISAKFAGSPNVEPAADPVSLSTKAKPSPDLYVAAARLSEKAGKTAEAERHYQRALRIDSQHAGALVGYARLKDRQDQMEEATRLYQQAARAHPKSALILNDLGLCLARQRKFHESLAALERAIQLEPKKWLYRNNIAMVFIEMGKTDAALAQLKAVQEEAVAHYNVGYILQKKGDLQAAATHFAKAIEKDPSLTEARIWIAKLQEKPASTVQPAPRIASDKRVGPALQPASRGPATSPRELKAAPARSTTPTIGPRLAAPGGKLGPGGNRPPAGGFGPRSDRPRVSGQRPVQPPVRPGFSNVAPLPPPMSAAPRPTSGGPPPQRNEATPRVRLVHPLPPVVAPE
jgi:hypothetical protein